MTTFCYATKVTYADNAKCKTALASDIQSTETSFYLINTTTAVCVKTGASTSLKATACTSTQITANTFTDATCGAGSAGANNAASDCGASAVFTNKITV